MDINIEAVKKAINIANFNHTELLEIALTHPSYIYEDRNLNSQQKDKQECDYRRQAILGDAILNAVVVDYLHENDSTLNQGKITDFKNNLVSREKACEFAHKLNLRNICRLGGSAKDKDISDQVSLFGEMFEAFDFEPELKQALQQIKAELPDLDEEKERFEDWRQNNGQGWIDKISNILGHDLQLDDEQRNLLKQYYNANRCLLEELNSNSNVTPTVREEIKNKLFGI